MNRNIRLSQEDTTGRSKRKIRNTDGIKQFSNQKTIHAFKKAQEAIERLMKRNQKINFNTVSLEAGVSKPFLYTQSNLRQQIESLREQTDQAPLPELSLMISLKQENEKLKREVDKLQNLVRKTTDIIS
ncbi:DUF6262 family protein [Paenibacillus radicis (ex Xue et al. 2023)]|uniref:DUF6262 family protein n=1 Tax=Paenibacillus radicis (ex Xue et al. 2023) TaxID=2972489 RepID=A0ABT1YI23_9BACL|nr:DUF6262 family protein [Paenibacillus radicis (ex Xue et al. 2023)]MCR8632069.1 DUF6262 family protein [Paenibacillus radicis (ex Xue et al. 2023)]